MLEVIENNIPPTDSGFFLYFDSKRKTFLSETEGDMFFPGIPAELLRQDIIPVPQKKVVVHGLTGTGPAIKRIGDLMAKYSLAVDPILLSGETGVGKNHIAALVHRCSGRTGKFVVVDTPNISDNLFESKLFGHKKGAFTDAKFNKTGLVEEAAGGTLFLDEITEVPLDVQAKLLWFIDTQKYYTLGESNEKEADVRIIAATNKDLHEAVEEKKFRKDLYYRLNVLEIDVPPLRERKKDIKNLVLEYQRYLKGKEIGPGFWDELYDYHWPGNVRELLNVLKRAGIMLENPITGEKIASLLGRNGKKNPPEMKHSEPLKEIREKLKTGENFWQLIWKPFIDREFDRNTVKALLKWFYTKGSYSFKNMIRRLNVDEQDYQTFMSLVYKYKIDPRT